MPQTMLPEHWSAVQSAQQSPAGAVVPAASAKQASRDGHQLWFGGHLHLLVPLSHTRASLHWSSVQQESALLSEFSVRQEVVFVHQLPAIAAKQVLVEPL